MDQTSGEHKRFKFSIMKRIALLFLIALILSSIITTAASYQFMIKHAAQHGEEIARVVAMAVQTAIGSKDNLENLMNDAEFREQTHKTFRFICKRLGVRYLYLYTVDENEYRHYIICAASSDEDDEKMNAEYGFGSIDKGPLYDSEREVLNGDKDGEYEFIDNEYGDVCSFTLPIRENQELLALIGVDYNVESINNIAWDNIRIMVIQRLIVIGIAFVLSLLLIRQSVIRPILVLSERMKHFVNDRNNNIEVDRRKTLFEDEITDIEGSFDEMANDISKYVDHIKLLADEKAQNHAQLDIARKIQAGIVPQERVLVGKGYEVYGCEHPAREVGGDFYDIFCLDDENVCVIVGDISGKGISAALFMIMVRTAISEKLKNGCAIDEALNLVNREICMSNPENMFATVFAMMLNTGTGTVRYANAGHEAPLMLGKSTSFLKMNHGIALGLFEDSNIVMDELTLEDGEGIFIYTDGITESINGDMHQYGRDGLKMTVDGIYNESDNAYYADRLGRAVVSSVREYSDGLEQFDDITCTALVYNGNNSKELTPDIGSFNLVKRAILTSLGDSDVTKRIILVCEEMFVNIVNYSNADRVSFSYERIGGIFSVIFSDNGMPFDPVSANIREKEFSELDTGGMGIKLARVNSKEMIYIRSDDKNILTMKFDI